MTTKFQQRTIDRLTNRPAPHDHYPYYSTINHQPQFEEVPMDRNRMQDLKNIESMRKMMLIQEEIFKHQVQELHRLYKLQKYLMQELENGLIRRQRAKTAHTEAAINPVFSTPRWHQQTGHSSKIQDLITRDDAKEVSGASCSGDNNNSNTTSRILPIKLGLAMPDESTSTDQKDLKRIDEENDVEVELTLSIGHCTGRKRQKSDSDRDQEQLGSSSGKTSNGDECGESGAYQENTRPHWLLQDLSLNRT